MKMVGCVALVLWCASAVQGQIAGMTPRKDAGQIPSYELVSIHKMPKATGDERINDEVDGFRATDCTLRGLIAEAYGFSLGALDERQLVGGPAWARTQLFEVHAKVDSANVEKMKELKKADTMMMTVREMATRTPSYRMLMLQRLLEDRFKLKVHYEQRVMALYEMSVAKGGLRMKTAHPANPDSASMQMDDGKMEGENVPPVFIAMILGMELERPVEDKTVIGGNYNFELHWSRMGDEADNGTNDAAPSFFTAVQEQMGLKLRAGKGPVWVIVVDHAEMPSEN